MPVTENAPPRAYSVQSRPPSKLFRNLSSKIASIPMMFVSLVVFIGCSAWSFLYSFTDSRVLPTLHFVGFAQYERLFHADKWSVSVHNMFIFGFFALIFVFTIGFLLAVFIDQKIRFEDGFRTIFLYPFALSGIVTGLVWEWMLNPAFGLEKSMHDLGWTSFSFDWIANREMVVYAIVIASVWQGSGLVMALMLAGLRGIDDDIWKASRVDGIPKWRTYIFIVIPMMRPVFVTSIVLVAAGIVRTFDIVEAMTQGGPGYQSYFPAKYVYEFMFVSNLGHGLAAAATMMAVVAVFVTPWAYYEFGRKRT